jgi:outer membrane protein
LAASRRAPERENRQSLQKGVILNGSARISPPLEKGTANDVSGGISRLRTGLVDPPSNSLSPGWRRAAAVFFALTLAACGSVSRWTRPEGDGGWSPARRQEEIAQRAAAAGVDLGTGVPAPTGGAAQAPDTGAGPIDLNAALALAARGNRRIAEATQSVEIAKQRVADTRGRLLPNTLGTGRYTWYSDPLTTQVDLPPGTLAPGQTPPVVTTRAADFGVINGVLTLPIDLSGELRQALAAAQAGYRGEQARLWATTLEQQLQAVEAYFQLLEARSLREVTAQTIALDRQQVATAESRYVNGRVTKNDVLVVQVALQNAEQRLVQRDLAIQQARWALNNAIGVDVNAPTEVVDVASRPDVPSIDETLQLAYGHNPVLISLLEEQQRLDATIRSLQRSRLPRFAAGGAVDYSTTDLVLPQRVESGFTGFTWDLDTDRRREAQIAENRAAAERNRIAVEQQMRDLESALRSTRQSLEERLAALRAAEAAVSQAEENLRIRQQQFDVGRAQSDDVLIAEALLSQQRAILASARYQAHARRAELQRLVGLPLEDVSPVSQR